MSTAKSANIPSETFPLRSPELNECIDRFLNAMCDTSRRYILEFLATPTEGAAAETTNGVIEKRSGEIARYLGLSPATTSEHLRQLAALGLVKTRRQGNVIYYRLGNRLLARSFQDLLRALALHCTTLHTDPSP